MKKLILVCALLCLTAGTASAQLLRFGVKGGVTMLSTDVKAAASSSSAWSEFKSKDAGWNLGVMARINIPLSGLYIQPELVYNHAAYEMRNLGSGGTEKLKYGNFELPVLLGFKILFLRANVGPTFTLSHMSSGDFDVKRPDIGFQAGLGVTLGKFTADVRYHGYFNKNWKDLKISDVSQTLKANEGYWGISLGYFIF